MLHDSTTMRLEAGTHQSSRLAEGNRRVQVSPELCTEEEVCRLGLSWLIGVLLLLRSPPLLLVTTLLQVWAVS